MATVEDNQLLTQVGPGTPCGELLRRYWQPACYSGDLTAEEPARAVTIMGEELVIFRTSNGEYGCLEEHCAHRCTSLSYGFAEQDGIRCAYHGWKYDTSGQCIEQPFEPNGSSFKDRIKLKAYPAQALGGLVFIYMGPSPAPILPKWDVLSWTDGQRKMERQEILNCNWLQAQENSADVTHTYFLHSHSLYKLGERDRGTMRLYRPLERYGFQPFELGQIKGWQYGTNGEWPTELAAGNPLIFPTMVRTIEYPWHAMHFRVPLDDTRTHIFWVGFNANLPPASPDELEIPPIVEHQEQRKPNGRYDMRDFWAQDRMAWETQGKVVDRTREHLGASDLGIVMFRQMIKDQIAQVAKGEDPLGLMRGEDPGTIELPMWIVDDNGPTGAEFAKKTGMAKTGQPMSQYFDNRQVWFDVPEGAARNPGKF